MLGEKVACAAFSLNLYILSQMRVQCYSPLRQLHSDFGNFTHTHTHTSSSFSNDSLFHYFSASKYKVRKLHLSRLTGNSHLARE